MSKKENIKSVDDTPLDEQTKPEAVKDVTDTGVEKEKPKKKAKIDYSENAKKKFKPESLKIGKPEIDTDFTKHEQDTKNPLIAYKEPVVGDGDAPEPAAPKRGRGRPKGSTNQARTTGAKTSSSTDSSTEAMQNSQSMANFVPTVLDAAIMLISRTGFIENKPLQKHESDMLKESFLQAFPKIVISPKMAFFGGIFIVLGSRSKFL